jgi:hypothetical protein
MFVEPLRTNKPLWALAGVAVFIALGFIDPLAGATWEGDSGDMWYVVGQMLASRARPEAILEAIVFITLLLSITALLVGWVIQALLVVVWSFIRQSTGRKPGESQ